MPDVYADITVVEQAIYADVILYGIVQNAISNEIQAVAGEAIVSWSAVVIINGLAYKMDASNPAHANAFAGFAKTGVLAGNTLAIQNSGIADFPGWGLIAGSNYLAGLAGVITLTIASGMVFSKMVGYAITTDKMLITNNSPITLI